MPIADPLHRHTRTAQRGFAALAPDELPTHRQATWGQADRQADTGMTTDVKRGGELDQATVGLRVRCQAGQLLVGRRGIGLNRRQQQVQLIQQHLELPGESLRVQ